MTAFRRLCGTLVPPVSIALSAVSYAIVSLLLWRGATIFDPSPDLGASGGGIFGSADLALASAYLGTLAGLVLILAILVTYLFLPGLLTGLLALPAALTWRRPLRVLVLRRFGASEATARLRTVLRREVAPHGHVYTLADQDIDVPWYIRFPVVLTQLVFLHFRERRLKSRKAIERLRQAMRTTWARNLNWVVSRWKTFPLRCADAHWREAVAMAAEEVDAIVVDLSEPTENLGWEIRHCRQEGSGSKLVFVCRGNRREASTFLERQGVDVGPDGILALDDEGDAARLGAQIRDRSPTEHHRRPAGVRAHLRALAATAGPFVWAALLLGVVSFATSGRGGGAAEEPPNRLAALVEQARSPQARDSALAALSRRIELETRSRPDREWVGRFDATVLPLYRELWSDEPRRRTAILTDLARTGSRQAEELWRDVLAPGPAADSADVELALTGIAGARSSGNVPDLIRYLGSATFLREAALGVLALLDDPRAVPDLIALAGRDEGDWPQLRPTIHVALERILVGDAPALDRPLPRAVAERFDVLMMGAPGLRAEVLNIIPAGFGSTATAQRSSELTLFGDVSVAAQAATFTARSRTHVVVDFGGAAGFAKGVLEYAPMFDAGLLAVDVTDPGVVVRHIRLAADLGIPRLLVYLVGTGRADAPPLAEVHEDLASVLQSSGFDDDHRSLIADRAVPGSDPTDGRPTDALVAQLALWPHRAPVDTTGTRFAVAASYVDADGRTVVLGFREAGTVEPGQRLQVVGFGAAGEVLVVGPYDGHGLDFVEGVVVDASQTDGLEPGQVLADSGALSAHTRFRARITFLTEAEGGVEGLVSVLPGGGVIQRDEPLELTFRAREMVVSEFGSTPEGGVPISEQTIPARITLFDPIALAVGQRFRIRSGEHRLIGTGTVIDVGS